MTAVAFSPDGTRLATSSWYRTVKLWDPTDGHELVTFAGHRDAVRGLAFAPDVQLATAGTDGAVCVWVTASGRREAALCGHTWSVAGVAHVPGGCVVSAGADQTVRVWDADRNPEGMMFRGHAGPAAAGRVRPEANVWGGRRRARTGRPRRPPGWP